MPRKKTATIRKTGKVVNIKPEAPKFKPRDRKAGNKYTKENPFGYTA